MRRHTLPLVGRRERLADTKSLTLTVHLKPIGHAPSTLDMHGPQQLLARRRIIIYFLYIRNKYVVVVHVNTSCFLRRTFREYMIIKRIIGHHNAIHKTRQQRYSDIQKMSSSCLRQSQLHLSRQEQREPEEA